MPEDPPPGLYRSIHGILLCRDHAFDLTIQQLADEQWSLVPESQTRGYRCQRCSPNSFRGPPPREKEARRGCCAAINWDLWSPSCPYKPRG